MRSVVVLIAALLLSLCDISVLAVDTEVVSVGNSGNGSDVSVLVSGEYGPDRHCGGVDYDYYMGKYEVTAGEYCEFLNAVAKSDAYGLYNAEMSSIDYGCGIECSGDSGNYEYTVSADRFNRPVNYVSWGDAARYCNWLSNNQPTGLQDASTTEAGSYALNGAMTDAELLATSRSQGGRYFLPTEDEWYKSAYYNGQAGSYYAYPTSNDTMPGNILDSPDPGNNANFRISDDNYTIGSPYWTTEVGAFSNSDSPYGTFDQGGNLLEWTETAFDSSWCCVRGGSFSSEGVMLSSSNYNISYPSEEEYLLGFRVVEIPEPATILMLGVGILSMFRQRVSR